MERAGRDRKQLCESAAQHMRGLEVHLEFNMSWGQDLCIYPFSDLFESQGFCGWVLKGHFSPRAECCSNHILMLTGSMKKLGFVSGGTEIAVSFY